MTREKIITTPTGTRVRLPENLIPEVKPFVIGTLHRASGEFSTTEYGHAAMALAVAAISCASNNTTPEGQREYFRSCALEIINKRGKKILPFLRDELRLSLTDEDLENL